MSLVSKISRDKLHRLLKPYRTDKKTLDVGAFGMPGYSQYFSNRVGLDIKPGHGVDVVGDIYSMPFQDGEFEVVLCLSVLEHLENPPKAIIEMKRILKPGGIIIVSVPFMFPMHDVPGDYWRFTKFGLKKLFADWNIADLRAETNTQETLAVILQRICYQTKLRLDTVMKFCLFLFAKLLAHMPKIIKKVFGDIHKNQPEPEAFASAFFLVAIKR